MHTLTLITSRSKPTQPAVALTPRQRGTAQIHARTLNATVLVGDALVPELAPRAVVLLVTLAARNELAMSGAGFVMLAPRHNVHIRTGPEAIVTAPFVGLPDQPQRTVAAGKVPRQRHLELLGTGGIDRR